MTLFHLCQIIKSIGSENVLFCSVTKMAISLKNIFVFFSYVNNILVGFYCTLFPTIPFLLSTVFFFLPSCGWEFPSILSSFLIFNSGNKILLSFCYGPKVYTFYHIYFGNESYCILNFSTLDSLLVAFSISTSTHFRKFANRSTCILTLAQHNRVLLMVAMSRWSGLFPVEAIVNRDSFGKEVGKRSRKEV